MTTELYDKEADKTHLFTLVAAALWLSSNLTPTLRSRETPIYFTKPWSQTAQTYQDPACKMGNNSSKRITSHDRAILDMKLQRDKIKQYQKKIQVILDREHEIAKECLRRDDKAKARLALRRRKYQEQLLEKADKQLETLEQLVSTIEFSLMEKDVFYGLQQGNAALKEIQKEMSLEAVEKLMDETAEAIAYQKEIDALLAGHLTNDDEDAVEDELAAIEAEELAKRGENIDLPDAPTAEPVGRAETAEEARARRAKERARARREAAREQPREMLPA